MEAASIGLRRADVEGNGKVRSLHDFIAGLTKTEFETSLFVAKMLKVRFICSLLKMNQNFDIPNEKELFK